MSVEAGFYRGKGSIFNALTRFWTKSPFSHVELIVDGICYSSSIQDGGVRGKKIDMNPDKWHIVPVNWVSSKDILAYYEATKGQKYDGWALIGSMFFNRRSDINEAAFCAEWCAQALGLPNPQTYSPQTLFDMIGFLNVWRRPKR